MLGREFIPSPSEHVTSTEGDLPVNEKPLSEETRKRGAEILAAMQKYDVKLGFKARMFMALEEFYPEIKKKWDLKNLPKEIGRFVKIAIANNERQVKEGSKKRTRVLHSQNSATSKALWEARIKEAEGEWRALHTDPEYINRLPDGETRDAFWASLNQNHQDAMAAQRARSAARSVLRKGAKN